VTLVVLIVIHKDASKHSFLGSFASRLDVQVVAVGSGKTGDDGAVIKPTIAVGATVLYQKYSGTEFTENEQDFIVIRESDVLGVLS
jgi:co-chaperonin GroES (HSP10)